MNLAIWVGTVLQIDITGLLTGTHVAMHYSLTRPVIIFAGLQEDCGRVYRSI